MIAGDVREGRTWSASQRAKNAVLRALLRTAAAAAAKAPERLLVATGRLLGALAHGLLPGLRRLALDNLARALPTLDDAARRALGRQVFRELGSLLGHTAALLRPGARPALLPFEGDGARPLLDALAEGHGVLFVSAHLGPWEHVAATLVAHGVPLTAVARESYDPGLTVLYERVRSATCVPCIYRGGAGSGARMLRVLRRGEVLGVPMDLRSRVPSVPVPFLGGVAEAPVGPARLALRTGAAVVVGTAAPGSPPPATGRPFPFVLTTTRIDVADLPPGAAGERALTARVAEALSHRILALPHVWVWPHRRFDADSSSKGSPSG